MIDDHNNNNNDFKLDYNEFTDMTNDEYKLKLGFAKKSNFAFSDPNKTRYNKLQAQMIMGANFY